MGGSDVDVMSIDFTPVQSGDWGGLVSELEIVVVSTRVGRTNS